MKIVIAIDSYKGSMTSLMSGEAARDGIMRAFSDAEVKIMPIADGGEGTVDSLVRGLGGKYREIVVNDPLCRKIKASYGMIGDTAVIEMSAASGIALLSRDELSPMDTTTFGVGEMINDAIKGGCREFLIGIGGSATNDGGVGMLSALGFEFLDKDKNPVSFGAKGLKDICEISDKKTLPELAECKFNIACDVKNPLCGPLGCSYIFSPQKGATESEVELMDGYMRHFAELTVKKYKDADPMREGAGAAGGLGFAFSSYLGGELRSGIELILDKIGLEEEIKNADLVITGEGRIDAQTAMGKAPIGIARLAKKYGKPVIALCGAVARDANACNAHGIDAIFSIQRGATTLDEAMNIENAKLNMADTAEQAVRLFALGKF